MSTVAPLSAPPRRRPRSYQVLDFSASELRRRSFWAGWGGAILTMAIGLLVVALLVGWVLLWVNRPGGGNMALLVTGCVAFTLVLAVLGLLQVRLTRHWKLSQAETLFLTGVSHGMRTPIGAIRAAAQALQQPNLSDEQRERLLMAIVHETRRLGLQVDNVLETGRLEIEELAFSREVMAVETLLEKIARDMREVFTVRGGRLDLDLEPCTVNADERTLRILVENLLDNALKYSSEAPHVTVQLRCVDEFVLIRVLDQGAGFPRADVPDLFRRFVRGDSNMKGTGLGLPLARSIARAHGGDVHLHSKGKGQGAVAEVWLPRAEQTSEDGNG